MQMNELGFYTLPGAPRSPRDLIAEVQAAEALGIGACFISERFNIKEAATLSGAVGAVSTQLRHRHRGDEPQHAPSRWSPPATRRRCTASPAAASRSASGAASTRCSTPFGLPHITTAQMEDFAGLMRRLWHGETVVGHDGPAGSWPFLRLDPTFDEDIPLGSPRSVRTRCASPGGRSTRSCCTRSSPTRRRRAACATVQGGGRAGRARPGVGPGVVVLRDDRRPPARAGAAEEDRRAHGHLPAGLRRPDGANERLGPGGAGALPRRPVRRRLPGRDRPDGHDRGARARRHADPRRVAGAGGHRVAGTCVGRRSSASSTSVPTA